MVKSGIVTRTAVCRTGAGPGSAAGVVPSKEQLIQPEYHSN